MFDRYDLGGGNQHHTHTHKITEQRAPTDESVRLLAEMERAAERKYANGIRLETNDFKCVVNIYQDYPNDQTIAVARFDLNGQRMETEYRQRRSVEQDASGRALAIGLVEAIAEKIARECLNEFADAFYKRIPG